ncbi:MAG TPA: hypothetical protein VMU92_04305 [Acidobacteriaceae bacterium]|nr:hypothetical protein [Acidobacteriaceae bacterium]
MEKARELEKYLSPTPITIIYGIAAVSYAIAVTLFFGLLIVVGAIVETETAVMVFALVALIPAVFIFMAVFLRPNDPVSRYIRGAADSIRRPMPVTPENCTFKVHMMDGETLCIKMSFFYPAKDRSADLKERLYTVVHGALSQDFSTRVIVPTYKEIETTLDKPLAFLAEERDIPVFYPEIHDVYCARDEAATPAAAPAAFANTGTWS